MYNQPLPPPVVSNLGVPSLGRFAALAVGATLLLIGVSGALSSA